MDAARILHEAPLTRFAGVLSSAGSSYGKTIAEAANLTDRHTTALAAAQARLAEAGLPCAMRSFGSTPAVRHARALPGITEVRCGIYVFQDLFQAGIGACGLDDVALSVLATVIARQPHYNRVVIDAGGLALSKDRSTAGHPFDAHYGRVCEVETGVPVGDLAVMTVSQELGLVSSLSGAPIALHRFPVGTRVRILPNHADMTAAAYDTYAVVAGDSRVRALWPRINHWS